MNTTKQAYALAALSLAIAAAGCGSDNNKKAEEAAQASVDTGVTEANALVPDALKKSLTFVAAKAEEDDMAVVVPSGWSESFMPGSYEPPDESNLGFMTRFTVGSNCDGYCKKKDWKAAVAKTEFGQFLESDRFEIKKDEALGANGRLLVASADDSTYVVSAWWKDDASRYFYCRANLEKEISGAVDAFEKACRAASVLSW
jgi:hypothetical protein